MFKSAVTSFSPILKVYQQVSFIPLIFSLEFIFPSEHGLIFLFCLQRKHPALLRSLAFTGAEAARGYCRLSKRPFGVREEWILPWKCCRCACPRCMWYRGAVPARSGCGLINLSICYLGRRLAAEWRESLRSLGSPSCQAVRGPWCGARIWSNSGGIGVAGSIHPCNGECCTKCWGGGEKHLENKVRSGAVSFPFKRRSLRLRKQPVKSENVVCVCLIWAKENIRRNNREHWALSLQGRGEGSWSWWGGEAGAALLCEKWGFASEVVRGMLRRGNEWESKASVCGRNAGAPS